MENVILTVHLILAAALVGIVLLQRSEGGGLGMGGGGGGAGGGVMSGRAAANALSRLTWILGVAIFATSITLTILAARQAANSSIMDQFGGTAGQQQPAGSLPGLPAYTPPPTTAGNPQVPPSPEAAEEDAPEAAPEAAVPATPPAVEAPVTEAPVTEAPAAIAPAAPEAAAPEAAAPEAEAVTPPAPAETAPATPAPAEPAAPPATN